MKDSWFLQEEVVARLTNVASLSAEWIAVEEQRDSYIEHFLAVVVPIRMSKARVSISNVSWAEDFDYCNGRVSFRRIGRRQYLGLKFRRLFALTFTGSKYVSEGKSVVMREKTQGDATVSDTILARREIVAQFLSVSKQEALWCIRSQRYSERALAEFGLESGSGYEKTASAHYFWEYSDVPHHHRQSRPRMRSFSQIFGKCLLKL